MKLLNIACGSRYSKEWINIDFYADSNFVQKVNILGGLPFKNDSIDAVYSSHFLEHLSKKQAIDVLSEAKRLLKYNGIIRIVVPDLENVCKEYLKVLDEVDNEPLLHKKYDWITTELLDQLVRVNGGGDMAPFFTNIVENNNTKISDYILERIGHALVEETTINNKKIITINKIKNKITYMYLRLIRSLIPKNLRDLVFVNTSIGEKHQWMYDKYSLKKLFETLGFKDICIKSFNDSNISNFNNYKLDIKEDGTPYKGVSSLYIEARK